LGRAKRLGAAGMASIDKDQAFCSKKNYLTKSV